MEYSAGAIPFKDGKYHLIKNAESQEWGFPKGHLEEGESAEEAAVRELLEEAGMKASFVKGFCETVSYVMGSNGKGKTVTYFLGLVNQEGEPTHGHEVCDCGWFTYERAMRLLVHDDVKSLLEQANNLMKENLS